MEVSFSFKEISARDYIFFNAETDLVDVQTMDNSAGIFSVQDEKEPLLFTNPYQKALDSARRLLI